MHLINAQFPGALVPPTHVALDFVEVVEALPLGIVQSESDVGEVVGSELEIHVS